MRDGTWLTSCHPYCWPERQAGPAESTAAWSVTHFALGWACNSGQKLAYRAGPFALDRLSSVQLWITATLGGVLGR